jgi:hypothetical protein
MRVGFVPVLYSNVAVVECVDALALEAALQGGLESFVVWRVSDRAVVVDHERIDDVLKLLRRQGQTPKVTLE